MFKKIYEELVAIRTELQLMRKDTAPIVEDLDGICIKTFCSNQSIQSTVISFSLTCHDWLKLKQSKDWKGLQQQISKYQRKYNRMRQTENPDLPEKE
ncbi:hypothetical protein D5281_11660 [bacterium 1xD42-62]|uniref:Uncharacterized protein n=1 Tax=Parablautia muri TaxID=2320879 RepID=A0A9X5GSI7_9FIRM|nr:hypothetical protein [Parablautia muri]